MIIDYWNADDLSHNLRLEKLYDDNDEIVLSSMLKKLGSRASILSTIEIETINRCNNDCSFCPANRNADRRKAVFMDEALFKKIIDELAEMNYMGRISLFSNCEPLLDKRILDFIAYAKFKLPNAYHALFTNGILLQGSAYDSLVSNLNFLRINNYNDKIEVNANIKEIGEENHDEKECLVLTEVRKKHQVLLNRGGLSPNNDVMREYNSPCVLPFFQMIIRPDGKVSRCCQDVYGNESLGDVNVDTIYDIWNGLLFKKLRTDMLEGNRKSLKFCEGCDISGLTNYFPENWEYEYFQTVVDKIKDAAKKKNILLYKIKNAVTLTDTLNSLGVNSICSFVDIDLEKFLKKGFYIVLGQVTDSDMDVLEKCSCRLGIDYIIYSRNLNSAIHRSDFYGKKQTINQLKQASENGKLIVCGAGLTSQKVIDNYKLQPSCVCDNYKANEMYMDTTVIKVNDIPIDEGFVYLVGAYDYVDIIKQLNNMGASSSQIVIGMHLLVD